MTREEQLYNSIMQNIATIEQYKPLRVQIKELTTTFENIWQNLFTLRDKVALAVLAFICISVNSIDFSSQEELEEELYYSYYNINY